MTGDRGLRAPPIRMGIQLLLAISTGIIANDVLLAVIGSVRDIGSEDIPFLSAFLVALISGLVIGHVLRGRIPLVEHVSVPVAFACAGLYCLVKLGAATGDVKLAIALALIGSYTTSLSMLDAFPGGQWVTGRRDGLVDDGAVFALAIVASALATRAFIASPLVDQAWIVPACVLAGMGVLGLLVIQRDRREPLPRELPRLQQPLLASVRGFLLGLGILVFLAASLELLWIMNGLFGTPSMYAIVSEQVIYSLVLLAALAGCPTGAAAAKACLLARRRPWRVAGAASLVIVPILIAGMLLAASIVLEWLVAGAIMLFFVAGHVTGLLLQFTDSGYKGMHVAAVDSVA